MTDSNPKSNATAASMRKWMAVTAAFAATLGAAVFLVNWQVQTRQNELRLQFAMSAARLGRAIELKYESNREVVDNITNVMRLAENEARGNLLEVEGAKAKQDLNRQLNEAAKKLRSQLEQAESSKAEADATAKQAWELAFNAVDDCLTSVVTSTDAQLAVVSAAQDVGAAQAQLDLALATLSQTAPPNVALVQEPQPAPDAAQAPTPAPPQSAPATAGAASSVTVRAPLPSAGAPAPTELATQTQLAAGNASATPEPASVTQLRQQLKQVVSTLTAKKKAADNADKLVTSTCQRAGDGRDALSATEVSSEKAARLKLQLHSPRRQ